MGGQHTGWRLASLALAWLAGVALQLAERALMPAGMYRIALAAGCVAVLIAWRWRRWLPLALIGMVAIGFASAGWRAAERLSHALPAALEGEDVHVTGIVASLPQRGASGLRFRFEVEEARHRGEAVRLPPLLQVGWYSGFQEDAVLTPSQQELRAGQRWRFVLRLRAPHGHLNPHGFDHELQLFEQGIGATAYVRDAPAQLLHRAAGYPIERWRQGVRDAIEAQVPDRRAAGVLAALSVGDQSAIDREDWELFRQTGIAHLVSISGLHITMFAWGAGLAIAALWRRSHRAMAWWPAPLAAQWGGLAAALLYALCSGWGVPSQRTVWMLSTVTVLQALGRRWPWPLVLLAAAVVVTALDPWALLQPGFWLSFVAVGLLMASSEVRPGATPEGTAPWRRRLRAELRSQLVATLGLAPLTLVFFQQLALVGFAANLVAIPLVTLLITPLALLGIVAAPLWWFGAWIVQRLCVGLAWLAGMPHALWTVPAAPAWAQASGLAGAVLLVLPLPWRLRLMALPLALPLLLPPLARPPEGRFELVAADVGQGTSVLVRTRHHLLVYDTGPQYSRETDAGQRVLLPLLRARGETRIDKLVLSHRDLDHVGGARTLLQSTPVVELLSSLEDGHPLLALASAATRCHGGQAWEWDGVRFQVLQPPAPAYGARLKSNAMSCVLRISSPASGSVLLSGDIERDQEARLVAEQPEALRSDWLLVPHHGSRTSSTESFVDAVQPRGAVVQAGYRNRFGHPAGDVVARYRRRGIIVFDTASCGAWQWPGGPQGQGVCQRDVARRYWHHRPLPAGG
ncbi:DNA internalization-related competence protein ComEC/Rec2 [Piscinibacter sp. XHJ-5]|uniref:DNA internalization-related competence protein ComEC/Rec2 n=1 Tax=Piscinibacter sp. XHJ-5 TaxID=3037797 RepID=UPI002452A624|nr:DNA internalization-related competence protein ComEC/Rec2 [Piscinibacter sp. XHJ-5]